MKRYALIGGENTVVGLVENPSDEQLQTIAGIYALALDVTDYQPPPQLGWSFNGQVIVGTSPSKKITKLAMRQRFTVNEMLAMMEAANTTPIVKYLMDNLSLATFVDLSRPDTQAGVALLVQLQLLTQERATVILTTPPTALEIYQG